MATHMPATTTQHRMATLISWETAGSKCEEERGMEVGVCEYYIKF